MRRFMIDERTVDGAHWQFCNLCLCGCEQDSSRAPVTGCDVPTVRPLAMLQAADSWPSSFAVDAVVAASRRG